MTPTPEKPPKKPNDTQRGEQENLDYSPHTHNHRCTHTESVQPEHLTPSRPPPIAPPGPAPGRTEDRKARKKHHDHLRRASQNPKTSENNKGKRGASLEGEKKKHTEEAETEAVGEARQVEEPRAPLASIAQAAMTAVPPVGCVGKTTDRCSKTLSRKRKT
jgi:hypothetical protein